MKIDVRGKIVLVRYGQNFRGVKAFVAQEHGAAGVLIYSDPADDGWRHGRQISARARGVRTPACSAARSATCSSFPAIPPRRESLRCRRCRIPNARRPEQSAQLPKIPTTPLSYADAWPILEHLGGPDSPRDWQGSLPFTYHVGPGPVKVKMHLKQDYQFRTIWDVIGRIRGSELPDEWVVAGNHRDAWVYGAVDPNSGTAAMLESVHGIGELLKSGWKPKRTIVFGSWDARRRRTDRLHRMGRAARSRTGQRGRLLQHGCGGFGPEVRRVVGAHAQAVYARRDQGRAQPQGRHGL